MDERDIYSAGGQPQDGQQPGGAQPPQYGQQYSGGQKPYVRKKRGWAGKAGFFLLGAAAGIALLLVAARIFPMRIGATQAGSYGGGSDYEDGSVVNKYSMTKLDVLE